MVTMRIWLRPASARWASGTCISISLRKPALEIEVRPVPLISPDILGTRSPSKSARAGVAGASAARAARAARAVVLMSDLRVGCYRLTGGAADRTRDLEDRRPHVLRRPVGKGEDGELRIHPQRCREHRSVDDVDILVGVQLQLGRHHRALRVAPPGAA